jgi:hypothetical protein
MTALLRHRIQTLRLREDAPFPSEGEDAQQMIREWRHANLIRRLDKDRPHDDHNFDPFTEEQDYE